MLFLLLLVLFLAPYTQQQMSNNQQNPDLSHLTPLQIEVTQHGATERPFTGKYYQHRAKGTYHCVVCGALLFTSEAKFDSPCGWPSFDAPAEREHVLFIDDYSHAMHRIEVRCANCNAHLGHIFPDGPTLTGNRYCINSASLDFHASPQSSKE